MRHDYVGPIYVAVTGPTGWQTTATGLAFSLDGVTWYTSGAAIVTATASPITLANSTTGTRCFVSIPAQSLPISGLSNALVKVMVRLTNGSDTPVMTAAGKFWIE